MKQALAIVAGLATACAGTHPPAVRQASPPPVAAPIVSSPAPIPAWHPAAPYITAGQDEAGYQRWLAEAAWRPVWVRSFQDYLDAAGVGDVVPTWQLFRTATSWQRCFASPFDMPPTSVWPHIVQTLRYVRRHVIPVIGPVEPVSVYRNPLLNYCAGGAPGSAHQHLYAVDLVPTRPMTREAMIETLCATHKWRGTGYQTGLGFYSGLRFHVDSMRFRKWLADGSGATPCAPPPIVPVAPIPTLELPAPAASIASTSAAEGSGDLAPKK